MKLNFIKKVLREDPKATIIFTPRTNYSVLRSIFQKVSKEIKDIYFKSKNLTPDLVEKDIHPMRLSEEEKGQFAKEFHIHRKRLRDFKDTMNRVCVVMNHDLSGIRLVGDKVTDYKEIIMLIWRL